jgi:hypothetical protein
MFRVKDVLVGLLDNMNGEHRFYEVTKVYKSDTMTLYDIRALKTGIMYHKVMLPEGYYKKIDKVR